MVIFGISISMVLVWIFVAILMIIIEAATVGLASIWFAIGALIAMVVALLGFSIEIQTIVFLVISLVLLTFTRKIFVNKLKTGSEKTNTEAVIGKTCVVVGKIKPHDVGQVKIGGQVWSALGENDEETIEKDTPCEVVAIQGVKLIVKVK